ncbi:MAG: phosphoribosyl-AMP cyclohydrolase [Candidatus Tectomicrobia bacterium]|nr:phosphoribosyl-AMP cyclohydrolase [Candidatus Tectomicrobia bacterium]
MELSDELLFDKNGLIPAIIQDVKNGEVLMLAYMNRQSLEMTLQSGFTHFWSRSREAFWMKGETSGHTQLVKEISYDCDGDTLLIKVDQKGSACHTGNRSCFYRTLQGEKR